ncbi:MAG: diguanylate cyclase [Deltaproteobacteria bacterium]|nr:diguanylate cyclase [Deltaproteobacteria bacterium]
MSSYPFAPSTKTTKSVAPGRRARTSSLPLEVLVVDDDASTLSGLAKAVTLLGHHCRTARDGADALALIAERPVDVVIADWEMPKMTGAELCEQIRASAADDAPYTYFILLTGFHDRDHLLAGMEAGADDYQRKPVDVDELEARLVSAARVVELHRRLTTRAAALRRDSKRFYAASRTDPLTGAGNRLRMNEEIEAAMARASRYGHRYSLAMCDIDFFKKLNDALGHVAGDAALQRVVDTIATTVRTGDAVFRYGGEEFVVLLVELELGGAARVMDRVRAEIERLELPSGSSGPMTMSIGVAELDLARDRTAADWIGRADAALYTAKARGRNRVVASPSREG